MDRMAQTALNSMKNLMENQMATAHNLSNLVTPGYRQDVITDFSALYFIMLYYITLSYVILSYSMI